MERVLDQQGRWRNKVVAFRMSPEEDEVLEAKVKLSGLTKQEYIIRRLTDREITVVGNPRVYKTLRGQMELIYQELQRLAVDEEVPPDLLETLQMVALTLNGLKVFRTEPRGPFAADQHVHLLALEPLALRLVGLSFFDSLSLQTENTNF